MPLLRISISSGKLTFAPLMILESPGTMQSANTTTRCCNVLPDATILWTDAAEEDGVGNIVNKVAPLPNACATIDCSGVTECNTKDNGGF